MSSYDIIGIGRIRSSDQSRRHRSFTTAELKRISVKRVRVSVTQGFAMICVDGKPIPSLAFQDDPDLIDGEWISSRSDFYFKKTVLHHPCEFAYHYRDRLFHALGYERSYFYYWEEA